MHLYYKPRVSYTTLSDITCKEVCEYSEQNRYDNKIPSHLFILHLMIH